jgi:glycerate 2-kinase
MRAAIEAVDAGALVRRALDDAEISGAVHRAASVDVMAAGKAAVPMLDACVAALKRPIRRMVAAGPAGAERAEGRGAALIPAGAEWYGAGHPLPTEGSVSAGRRALALAAALEPADLLVLLLSGGGSALMAVPPDGITLAEKQETARRLMEHGADIYELNAVRKHLSAIKGGQLAAAARGRVYTLAISDVVGDDLSVIASGPTVADGSTFAMALEVIERRGGRRMYPSAVVRRLERGAAGGLPETPKPGDRRLAQATARVIGPQRGAIEGARQAALARGYHVHVVPHPVTGEARVAAVRHLQEVAALAGTLPRPLCVIASGETTVSVTGSGRGGRNQEFACTMATMMADFGTAVAASVGTDGIDGPTDAAGAIVDTTTLARARAQRIGEPEAYLRNNDSYTFFDRLGDLIRTGPTGTNVGDLQVVLIAGETSGRSNAYAFT